MKGWKTVVIAIISFLIYALGWEQLVQYLDAQMIALISSILMFIMRLLTKTPVFRK
jgi:hypothetical protein